MAANKLTPIEVLQKKKLELTVKSDALVNVLEDNFSYLQENMGSLIIDATVDAATSKLPPFVQNLIGVKHYEEDDDNEEQNNFASTASLSKFEGIADMALSVVPIFAKGIKGLLLTFALKKAKDLIFKRKV
ncbi:hypothetical protein LJB98_01970 [Bacteroidales bacterium OttesenSCG-928-M11]|nr:hypothetical protein [Bacteroidales bacterium OttesenSCG-928-M11]